MNRDKALRNGYGDAVKDQLTYDSVAIKIYDSVTTSEVLNEQTYVLLSQQTAVDQSDFRMFRWKCVQTIEIVSKQYNSVSKDIVDDISEQIEQIIIYPDNQPGNGGMAPQDGWEFKDVILDSVSYTEFNLTNNYYEITKILQFSCIITKNS